LLLDLIEWLKRTRLAGLMARCANTPEMGRNKLDDDVFGRI
jgi:hypothetical protein